MDLVKEFKEKEQDVLFILKVDMGKGRVEYIDYRKNDSPEELAFEFCKKFGLNVKVYDFVAESLRQKLHQLDTHANVDTRTRGVNHPQDSLERNNPLVQARGTANASSDESKQGRSTKTKQDARWDSTRVVTSKTTTQRDTKSPETSDRVQFYSGKPDERTAEFGARARESNNLFDKYRNRQEIYENCPEEENEVGQARKLQVEAEIKDVYDRLFFDSKKRQTSAPNLLRSIRPPSADAMLSVSQSTRSGVEASNRLYYAGLKNKSIRE